jgi:hypothetical protein
MVTGEGVDRRAIRGMKCTNGSSTPMAPVGTNYTSNSGPLGFTVSELASSPRY